MIQLTTPINIPNISRWKILDLTVRDENTIPSLDATIQILAPTGAIYAQYTLSARNDGTVSRLVNGPGLYSGRFTYENDAALAGAYTALLAAHDSVANLAQKKQAIGLAMLSIGMIPTSLSGV
jgi:hypothetical protein